MAVTISAIYRYPVKGLSPERLQSVALTPGQCLPHDRRFAIALPSTRFDPEQPEWLSKIHFVMLMRDEKLAQLQTRFDDDTDELTVERGDRTVLRESLADAEGRRRAGAFFDEFLAGEVEGPLRLVEAPGHTFADARRKPNATTDQYVSLINLASIAALEQSIGAPVAAAVSRQCLFRGRAGLERTRLAGLRDSGGGRAAAGHRGDHPLRRDPGQPGDGRTRPRHRRQPAARLWPQSDGHLCRGDAGRRGCPRRRVGPAIRIADVVFRGWATLPSG